MDRTSRQPAPPLPARPVIERLEERVLHSADFAPAAFGGAEPAPAEQRLIEASDHAATQGGSEIVFIDAAVPDASTLLADLQAQQAAGRRIEIVWIAAGEDGLSVIGQTLAGREGVSAVHVLAHGEDGRLQLGNAVLDADTLLLRAPEIAQWGEALTTDADLLLYGCDLAAGPQGLQLIDGLAMLTGADVAASTDRTGATAAGGDWDLEARTGAIQATSAASSTAQAQWAGVLTLATPGSTGTAIWTENGYSTPQSGNWDGMTLATTQSSTAVTAQWSSVTGASAPTRDEMIVAGVDGSGNIRAERWNGSAWVSLSSSPLGTSSATNRMPVAVAYESKSGDAVFVWSDQGDDDTEPALYYAVWNGSSWSSTRELTAYGGAEAQQLKLVSNPTKDEMILVVSDANSDDHALVWNGSSWGHAVTLDTSNSGSTYQRALDVAYESQSGQALVVFGKSGDASVWYTTWNGTSWSTAVAAGSYSTNYTPQVIKLASDPTSDRIALGLISTYNGSTATSFSYWTGSAWGGVLTTPATSSSSVGTAMDVAYGGDGKLLAVFRDGSDTKVHYLTMAAGSSSWSSEATGPDLGTTAASLMLSADPGSKYVMLGALTTGGGSISYTLWNGSGWEATTTVANSTGFGNSVNATGIQPMAFLWDAYTPNKTNTLWISSQETSSSAGWTGIHTIDNEGIVELGKPNFSVGSGSTSGTYSHVLDLSAFGVSAGLDDFIVLSRDLTIAGVALNKGDLIFTLDNSATLTGISGTVEANDLVLFRPTTAGDYSAGSFSKLLDNLRPQVLGIGVSDDVKGLALVEQDTVIGGTSVTAGTFLFTLEGVAGSVYRYDGNGGLLGGLLVGNVVELVSSSATAIDQAILGLEVVTASTPLANVTLTAGSLLMSLAAGDTVGSNNLAVTAQDIFVLTPTSGSASTATLLVQGASLGMSGEHVDGLALSLDAAPVITSNGGGGSANVSFAENGTGAVTTVTAVDADPDTVLTYSIVGGADAAKFTIDASTGALRFVAAPDFEAPADADANNGYVVIVQASDGTLTDTQTITVNVTNVNEAPAITSNGGGSYAAVVVDEGQTLVSTVTASDPDAGSTLSYSISGGSGAADFEIDAATGVLRFKTAPVYSGYNLSVVTVTVSDGSKSDSQTLYVVVQEASNTDPEVAITGGDNLSVNVQENTTHVTTVQATVGGAPGSVTYEIAGGTDAALFTIDASTGVLAFLAAPDRESAGHAPVYDVVVRATAASRSDTQSITVNVTDANEAPVNTLPASLTTAEDTPLTVTGLSIADVDAGDTVFSVTLTVGHGILNVSDQLAGGVPSSGIVGNGTGTLTLTGTLTQINATLGGGGSVLTYTPEAEFHGNDLLTLVSDDRGQDGSATALTDTDSVTIVVTSANDAPAIAVPLADQSATEDQAWSHTVPTGTFTDVDGDPLTWSATLADGSALPGWLAFDTATRTFSGTPANGDVGSYTLRVTASDGQGGSTHADFALTVANVNDAPTVATPVPDQSATEDQAWSYSVPAGSFADVDAGDTLTWSATLADGNALPSWLSFDAATRTFSGTPGNADVGSLVLRVTVTDAASATADSDFTLTIANTNDAPTVAQPLADQAATQGLAFTFTVPAGAITDIDAGDTLAYTAQLAGGGSLPSWLSFNAATRTFSGTPGAGDVGTLTVRVTASDGHGGSVFDDFTLAIADANDAPTGQSGSLTLVEDTPYAFVRADFDFGFADPLDTPGHAFAGIVIDSLPGAGTLTLNGSAVAAGTFVSAAELDAGKLVYQGGANGWGTGYASIGFRVRDDGGTALGGQDTAATAATLTLSLTPVNDAPLFATNELSVQQGGTATLVLVLDDPDDAPAQLQLRVSAASAGHFELAGSPGVGIDAFTYEQARAGLVRFVHDGSSAAPGYVLTVADAQGAGGAQAGRVGFTPSTSTAPTPASAEPEKNEPPEDAEPEKPAETASEAPTPSVAALADAAARLPSSADLLGAAPNTELDALRGPTAPSYQLALALPTESLNRSDASLAYFGAIGMEYGALNYSPLTQASYGESLARNFDALREQIQEQVDLHKNVVASSIAVTTGLSVGYVIWLVRGGVLLGSMLSAMPAWQMIDPLPVLARNRGGNGPHPDGEGDDAVENLFSDDDPPAAPPAPRAPTAMPAATAEGAPA